MRVENTGNVFSTGPVSRNPDGIQHARWTCDDVTRHCRVGFEVIRVNRICLVVATEIIMILNSMYSLDFPFVETASWTLVSNVMVLQDLLRAKHVLLTV